MVELSPNAKLPQAAHLVLASELLPSSGSCPTCSLVPWIHLPRLCLSLFPSSLSRLVIHLPFSRSWCLRSCSVIWDSTKSLSLHPAFLGYFPPVRSFFCRSRFLSFLIYTSASQSSAKPTRQESQQVNKYPDPFNIQHKPIILPTIQHPDNTIMSRDNVLCPRAVQDLIADGHIIVIYDEYVLKLDSWLERHPGGSLAILHMVGKDATDEINA